MNVSRVQTSPSSAGSDFSIRRILSDDLGSTGNNSSAPSWVCCTRYQPPRLPRAAGTSRPRRSGRHARVPFTCAQAAALEAAYVRSPYLAPPALRALAAALHLRDDRIKIWFQNRRARERREKSFSVHQPHSVALPATVTTQTTGLTENWSQRLEYIMSSDRSYQSDSECCKTGAVDGGRPVSSSDESVGSPVRPESPLDVESIVD